MGLFERNKRMINAQDINDLNKEFQRNNQNKNLNNLHNMILLIKMN